jgi:short-subunit dehydrogenase
MDKLRNIDENIKVKNK